MNDRQRIAHLIGEQDASQQEAAWQWLGQTIAAIALWRLYRNRDHPMLRTMSDRDMQALAEDVAQTLLLKLWSHGYRILRNFKFKSTLKTYVTRIVISEVYHQLNKKAASQTREALEDDARLATGNVPLVAQDAPVETTSIQNDVQHAVLLCLARLNSAEKQIFEKRILYQLSSKQVAQQMNKTPNAVDSLKRRVRLKLRRCLHDKGIDKSTF